MREHLELSYEENNLTTQTNLFKYINLLKDVFGPIMGNMVACAQSECICPIFGLLTS